MGPDSEPSLPPLHLCPLSSSCPRLPTLEGTGSSEGSCGPFSEMWGQKKIYEFLWREKKCRDLILSPPPPPHLGQQSLACPPQASHLHPGPSNSPCTLTLKESLPKAQPGHANPAHPSSPVPPPPKLSFPSGPCRKLVTPRSLPFSLGGGHWSYIGASAPSPPPPLSLPPCPSSRALRPHLLQETWPRAQEPTGLFSHFTC